ncbi:DUF2012 domain-containing protein [bacterium]|nr:DUF2012 domain-containing protein [bacterium]
MRAFLVFISCMFMALQGMSQPLSKSSYNTLYYRYYKLSIAQAQRLYKHNSVSIDSFMTQMVLQVPNDSFSLITPEEPGNYLLAWIQNGQFYYRSYNKPFLRYKYSGVIGQGQLRFYTFSGQLVKDAEVTINSKKNKWDNIAFDEGCGCYPVDNEVSNRLMKVSKDGNFDYYRVSNAGLSIPSIDRSNPYAGTTIFPGYMVTNKPKYKHFDTLHVKAFVTNTEGHPLRKKLVVQMHANYKTVTLATIKPTTPGAYVYDIVLSDSLRLDQDIEITLRDSRTNQFIKNTKVHLEDYELKKASYASRMLRNYFRNGEPVEVVVDAFDANHLPMLDTRVKLKLKWNNSSVLYPPQYKSYDSVLNTLFEYNEMIDPSGTSIITIPQEVFLPTKGTYTVEVEQINSTGEFKNSSHYFTFDATASYYNYGQYANSVFVKHYVEGQSVEDEQLELVSYYENTELSREMVQLPLARKILPAEQRLVFVKNDSIVVDMRVEDNAYNYLELSGSRSHDSIKIEMKNPFGLDVYYRIYRNKNIVAKGMDSVLHFDEKDNTMFPYYVLYGYQWAGVEHFYEAQFVVKEKELSVKLQMPKAVFPGETVNASVQVTNYLDEPVKKVNLTAYSVSTEFPEIPLPDLPYFGRRFPTMSYKTSFSVAQVVFSGNRMVINKLVDQLHISDSAYYLKFIFPGKETRVYREKNAYKLPEFVPILVSEGMALGVAAMWLDEQLIYYSENESSRELVFKSTEGKHQLKIQTGLYTIVVKDLILNNYERCYLSIDPALNADSKVEIVATNEPHVFTQKTIDNINQQSLYIDDSRFYNDSIWIENNGTRKLLWAKSGPVNYQRHWYEELGKNLLSISGIKAGKTVLRINHDTFYFNFEPGNYYTIEYGILAAYALPAYPLNQEIISTAAPNILNSIRARPMYFANEIKQEIKRKEVHYKTKIEEKKWYESVKYYSYARSPKAHYGHIQLFNPYQMNLHNLWLVNTEHERFSYANYGSTEYGTIRLKNGNYTLVAIQGKGRVFIKKDIKIEKGGFVFINIKPGYFKKAEYADIEPYQQVIHRIARPEIRAVQLFPDLFTGDWKFLADTGYLGSVLGVVRDESTLSDMSGVTVFLEKNGYLVNAVVTNYWGEFIFRNVPEGEYMLKLQEDNYRFTTIEHVIIKNGKTAVANLTMKRLTASRYTTEAPVMSAEVYEKKNVVYGSGQVNVKVIDENGDGLLGANVAIYANDKIVKGTSADPQGAAILNDLPEGDYILKVFYVGMETKVLTLSLRNHKTYQLEIIMEPTYNSLYEVVIESKLEPIIKDAYGGTASHNVEEIGRLPVRGATGIIANTMSVQSIDGGAPVIRGGRSDQVITYIDGMPVRGRPANSSRFTGVDNETELAGTQDDRLQNDGILKENLSLFEGKNAPNRLRTNFKDYGYWVPNLLTDYDGMAYYTITFPDNITQWQNIIPAMDYHRNTGMALKTTKAFLPYSAQLGLPRFLVKGDEVKLSGKVINYTDDTLAGSVKFTANDTLLVEKTNLDIARQQSFDAIFKPQRADSVALTMTLNRNEQLLDGEQRSLAVFPDFIEKSEVHTIDLHSDTSFVINQKAKEKFGVIIYNDNRDFIMDQIDMLKRYHYGCVEQTASKLMALLLEKQLCQITGKTFYDDHMTKRMLARLAKFQKPNGSWGWWRNDETDPWMTIYVAKVLTKAQAMGYNSFAFTRAMNYLKRNTDEMSNRSYLESTVLLMESGYKTDDERLGKLDYSKLDDICKILFLKTRVLNGEKDSIAFELMKLMKKNRCGQVYWGNSDYVFYNDKSFITLTALQVLTKTGEKPRLVKAIERGLMQDACVSTGYMNTLCRASFIAYMLENMGVKSGETVTNSLLVNGKKVIEYPKKIESTDSSIAIQYTGYSESRVFVYRKYKVREAASDSGNYQINTVFLQNSEEVSSLKRGSDVRMEVSIKNRLSAHYAMIEIPIPAGCSYGNKEIAKFGYEVYREYRRDRVVIYCKNLPAGVHRFQIALEPRFEGTFTVLPTQLEEMYFPEKSGNNAVKKVTIEE